MSEQIQIDTLAYSSRMVDWSPLGKFVFTVSLLLVGILTSSIIVPIITFCIGMILMAYSTKMHIPKLIGIAIAEALLIMVVGCGMVSIMGTGDTEVIWDTEFLWFHIHMTHSSFNLAFLILFRALAGVTLMLAFASSTPIPHLMHALSQLHFPKEISELAVLVYRYSFLLLERMEKMWNAAQCRLGFNGIKRSIHTTAGISVGIFISSMEIAERSQWSLECRNYQGYFPVLNMPKKMNVKWCAVMICLIVVLMVIGIYSVGWIDVAELFFGVY